MLSSDNSIVDYSWMNECVFICEFMCVCVYKYMKYRKGVDAVSYRYLNRAQGRASR